MNSSSNSYALDCVHSQLVVFLFDSRLGFFFNSYPKFHLVIVSTLFHTAEILRKYFSYKIFQTFGKRDEYNENSCGQTQMQYILTLDRIFSRLCF